ncbi:dihydroxy-acid dehydratase [Streptomyces mirabilis]|uniref:dihydroxy-acid dehydratase n=1 Tax=Streptomyces mirabilis TaxID=68239 RepID=UPI0007658444|nr:dihydroxy-acid dehydratase [Streptomyces mirabilis]MCX4428634.1 dihydroxy-acid dehydratase [Streptomyces mirabilis]
MSQNSTRPQNGDAFNADDRDGFLHRAFMRGAGRGEESIRDRPVIGICTSWSELNPCNSGLRRLAEAVKRGVIQAGGLPLEFPTISLAEPFIRPTTLYLRNLMAMDVEEMITASPIDAVVLLGGCDKTVPAQLMGAASAGKPAIALAAGPRATGRFEGKPLTIDDLWPLSDRHRNGELDDAKWSELEGCLIPGVGTCNVLGTAVTMALIAETLGMALPGSTLLPATSAARGAAAEGTGRRAVALARSGQTPDDFITSTSLENAFRMLCAVGGSTNAVIHLEAIAGRLGHRLGLDTMAEWSRTTPVLADVRPSGPYLLEDLQDAGGLPAVLDRLGDLIRTDALSGTGESWSEFLVWTSSTRDTPHNPALRTADDPVFASGALALLRGSLAPDGAVIKVSAADPRLLSHRGRAVVFDGLADLNARIDDPDLDVDEDSVLVLRGVGPLGGPGMPEVGQLPIPKKLMSKGVTDMVRISDARMSGTATGAVVLHVAPESAAGGPLALVQDGDVIVLDATAGRLDLDVDPAELARRAPTPAPTPPTRGFAALYHRHITQSPQGCDFDFLTSTSLTTQGESS